MLADVGEIVPDRRGRGCYLVLRQTRAIVTDVDREWSRAGFSFHGTKYRPATW